MIVFFASKEIKRHLRKLWKTRKTVGLHFFVFLKHDWAEDTHLVESQIVHNGRGGVKYHPITAHHQGKTCQRLYTHTDKQQIEAH